MKQRLKKIKQACATSPPPSSPSPPVVLPKENVNDWQTKVQQLEETQRKLEALQEEEAVAAHLLDREIWKEEQTNVLNQVETCGQLSLDLMRMFKYVKMQIGISRDQVQNTRDSLCFHIIQHFCDPQDIDLDTEEGAIVAVRFIFNLESSDTLLVIDMKVTLGISDYTSFANVDLSNEEHGEIFPSSAAGCDTNGNFVLNSQDEKRILNSIPKYPSFGHLMYESRNGVLRNSTSHAKHYYETMIRTLTPLTDILPIVDFITAIPGVNVELWENLTNFQYYTTFDMFNTMLKNIAVSTFEQTNARISQMRNAAAPYLSNNVVRRWWPHAQSVNDVYIHLQKLDLMNRKRQRKTTRRKREENDDSDDN